MMIKTGDTVLHKPTQEMWQVAYVNGDYLAWCGWPAGLARLSDCVLVESCTKRRSRKLIARMAKSESHDHRAVWAKQELESIRNLKSTIRN